VINPINRCPTVIVTLDKVERFEREFVSCSRWRSSRDGISGR
jgi:hypothetical protein